MGLNRPWAFWRQVQYGTGFAAFWLLVGTSIYFGYFYNAPTCFDNRHNGAEAGIDCGGACTRICAFTVEKPTVRWARSFMVTEGQYNAVAYVENRNKVAASPEVPYTLQLFDVDGLIAERTGVTILPPDSVYPIFEARIETNDRVPTQTVLELGEVTMWVPANAGREQFTVNNRILTGADLKPRLEASLTNNDLVEAQNVEVVATIFDARGNALTASRTFIDRFPARGTATAVFTWPEPIAKTVRSCEVPTDIAIAIDLSGSMNNDSAAPPEPISSVLKAAGSFATRLRSNDQAALVTFASNAIINQTLTGDVAGVAKAIAALTISSAEEQGSTNTGDALKRAGEELNSVRHSDAARRVLVLLTDGLATAPDPEPETYALEAATAVKASGINIFAIGLGKNVNMDFVRKVASAENQAYAAVTTAQIDGIYKNITAALCEDGAAVIEIIPKTTAQFAELE
jgi:Mg-chelatase subunit ChlD